MTEKQKWKDEQIPITIFDIKRACRDYYSGDDTMVDWLIERLQSEARAEEPDKIYARWLEYKKKCECDDDWFMEFFKIHILKSPTPPASQKRFSEK